MAKPKNKSGGARKSGSDDENGAIGLGFLTTDKKLTPLGRMFVRYSMAAVAGGLSLVFIPVSKVIPQEAVKAFGPLIDIIAVGVVTGSTILIIKHYFDAEIRRELTNNANKQLAKEGQTVDDVLRQRNNGPGMAPPLIGEILRFRRAIAQPKS